MALALVALLRAPRAEVALRCTVELEFECDVSSRVGLFDDDAATIRLSVVRRLRGAWPEGPVAVAGLSATVRDSLTRVGNPICPPCSSAS